MLQCRMGPAMGNHTWQRPRGRHKTSWVERWADIREGFNLTIRPLSLHAVRPTAQMPSHFYQKELPTSSWALAGTHRRGDCPHVVCAQISTDPKVLPTPRGCKTGCCSSTQQFIN